MDLINIKVVDALLGRLIKKYFSKSSELIIVLMSHNMHH